jgi:hypothetical protein
MFGESLGRSANLPRDLALTWMGSSILPTGWGVASSPSVFNAFSSNHPGIINFALADGSIRTVKKDAPTTLLNQLAGMLDGALPDLTAILN